MVKSKCCRYAPFGCTVTRTKAIGIKVHEKVCEFRRFEIYLQAMEENKKLKQQIFDIKMAKPRGRPEVTVAAVDFRDFEKRLLADPKLVAKWRLLAGSPRKGVKALIVMFANVMPRFYKLRNLSEIDVNCWLPTLRTHGQLQRHSMENLADGLISAAEAFIEINDRYLSFGKIGDYRFRSVVPYDKTFVYNALSVAAKRKGGETLLWDGRCISMNLEI